MAKEGVRLFFILTLFVAFLSGCSKSMGDVSQSITDASQSSEIEERDSSREIIDKEEESLIDANEIKSDEETKALFVSENQPVGSWDNYFIVRNSAGVLYGLVDRSGQEILPCKYGNIDFVQIKEKTLLLVKDEGLYGLFDLDGTCLIDCKYMEIEYSIYSDFCVGIDFEGKYTLYNSDGSLGLPDKYDYIKLVYDKKIIAVTYDQEADSSEIKIYDANIKLVRTIFYEEGLIGYITPVEGGNSIQITNLGALAGKLNIMSIDENYEWSAINLDIKIDKYIIYGTKDGICIEDISTKESTIIWHTDEPYQQINVQGGGISDKVTGEKNISLSVYINENRYNLHVTLGDSINSIRIFDSDIVGIPTSYNEASINSKSRWGDFYNGKAYIIPENGYVYTIDTTGQKLMELEKPYTRTALLENGVVLFNSGYISIFDTDGNELLSDVNVAGCSLLHYGNFFIKDDQGNKGVINKYADIIVPLGKSDSSDNVYVRLEAYDSTYESYKLKGETEFSDRFTIINNEVDMTWALFDRKNDRLVTNFNDYEGENGAFYQYLLGNGGYPLISCDEKEVLVVVIKGDIYEVYSYADLTIE